MDRQVGRGAVHEVDALRPPARAEQGAEGAVQDADRQLVRLPDVAEASDQQVLADHHHAAVLLDVDDEGRVQQLTVLHQAHQGLPQGGLVGDQQAHRAEVGDLPGLRHPQAKGRAVSGGGRQLQQLGDLGGRDAGVRVGQGPLVDVHAAEHGPGVEPDLAGHFQIVGQ